jgi:hypothetical protein
MITNPRKGMLIAQGPASVFRGDPNDPASSVVALVSEFHPVWVDPERRTLGCNEILGVSVLEEERALAVLRGSFWSALGHKDADLIAFLRQRYNLPLPLPEVDRFDLQFDEVSDLIYVGVTRDAAGRILPDGPVSWWKITSVAAIAEDYVIRAS